MRKLAIILSTMLLLAGCEAQNDLITMEVHNQAMEEVRVNYEEELLALRMALEEVRSEVLLDEDETIVYDENLLADKIEEVENLNYLLEESHIQLDTLQLDYENRINVFKDLIYEKALQGSCLEQYNGITGQIYMEGTDLLEDGVEVVLNVFDEDYNLLWQYKWSGIDVSELSTHSEIKLTDHRLYVVVDGWLNSFDIETGDLTWQPVEVGSLYSYPKVDTSGIIYASGQYGPLLTAISEDGQVLWRVENQLLSNVVNLGLCGDFLLVETLNDTLIFTKDGEMIDYGAIDHARDYIFLVDYDSVNEVILDYSNQLDGAYAEMYSYLLMTHFVEEGKDLENVIRMAAYIDPLLQDEFATFFVYSTVMESYLGYTLDDLLLAIDEITMNNLSGQEQEIVDKMFEIAGTL